MANENTNKTSQFTLDDLSRFYDDMHYALDAYCIARQITLDTFDEIESDNFDERQERKRRINDAKQIESDLLETFSNNVTKYVNENRKQMKLFFEIQKDMPRELTEIFNALMGKNNG